MFLAQLRSSCLAAARLTPFQGARRKAPQETLARREVIAAPSLDRHPILFAEGVSGRGDLDQPAMRSRSRDRLRKLLVLDLLLLGLNTPWADAAKKMSAVLASVGQ